MLSSASSLPRAASSAHAAAAASPSAPPQHPLTDPEDLLDASIIAATPQATALGIQPGMSGREAVELMLAADADAT